VFFFFFFLPAGLGRYFVVFMFRESPTEAHNSLTLPDTERSM